MWFWKEIFIRLIIITTVQANLICPEVKDCKCREILKDSIEIRCPEYDNALNIQLNSGKSAILVCSTLIDYHKQFEIIEKLLPELNITIDHLQIHNCSLATNKSLVELLRKVNMDKVSELEVISSNVTFVDSNLNIAAIREEILLKLPGEVKCAEPVNLRGTKLLNLKLSDIVCPIESIDERPKICPIQCECLTVPGIMGLLVNCDSINLNKIPQLTNSNNLDFNHIELTIVNNSIVELPTAPSYPGFEKIFKIFASNNHIRNIVLANIPRKLQVLDLTNNNLTDISEEVLLTMKRQHMKVLLSKNPYSCVCSTSSFINIVKELPNVFLDFDTITCADGRLMKNLNLIDLCVDSQMVLQVFGALFVASLFLIMGIYYKYQKQIKIWLYAHNWCLWLVLDKETEEGKYYDAFIVFSHHDDEYVADLISKLESGPNPYKCCIHLRDWAPGELIPTQVINSVNNSRRTILILSEHFHESHWANWEFRVAHANSYAERRSRIIVIMKDNINMSNLNPDLQQFLKINTSLKYDDPLFWNKLKYAMPHKEKCESLETIQMA
ncbi:unnamed protein product [Diamesa hyperborea]